MRKAIKNTYLEEFLEHSGEAIVAMDKNERIFYINKEFTNLFGYSAEESLGRFINDMIIPKELYGETILNIRRLKEGEKVNIETVRKRKDGSLINVKIVGIPIFVKNKLMGIYGIYRDIQERVERKINLEKNEERYRRIIENMQDCFYRIDREGRIVMVSPSTAKFLGDSVEGMMGKLMTEFYQNPESRETFLRDLTKKKRIENYKLHLKKKDGTHVTVSDYSHFYYNEKGEIDGVEGVFRDITGIDQIQEELANSQKLLEDILQDSPIATYVIDMNHKIVYWNKEAEKITGRKANEMMGTDKHWEVFYPKKRPMIVDYFVNGESIPEILKRYANMDVEKNKIRNCIVGSVYFSHFYGGGKWLRFMIKPLYDHKNNMIGAIETIEDIHHRKQAQIALQKKLKELECLYSVVEATRITAPIKNIFIEVTKFLVTAWSNSKAIDVKIIFNGKEYGHRSFQDTSDKKVAPLMVNGIKKGEIRVYHEKKGHSEKGAVFPAEERKLLISVSRILGKHLERRQIVEQYEKLVKKSIAGIYILQKNKFVFVNPEFGRIFKCSPKKIIGRPATDFLIEKVTSHKSKGHLASFFIEGKTSDGKIISLKIITQAIEHGGKAAVMGTLHDITKLKAVEKKVRQFNQELKKKIAQKTVSLRTANRKLASLNRMKDEFISITSHELRSPLTNVKGFLSLAQEDPEMERAPEIIKKYINRAYENTEMLNNLINNILDVSLLGQGLIVVHRKKINVIDLLKSVLMGAIPQANGKGISIHMKNRLKSKKDIYLNLDEVRISQVMRNLLDNAIKFSSKNLPIVTEVERVIKNNAYWLKIKIRDRGIGIQKIDLPHIFEKFRSGQGNHIKGRWGAGLGLYIVKKVVELHKGFVEVETGFKKGTTFSIFLPYAND